MAKKKRRRKPGLLRCRNCGNYQLVEEMESRVCLTCLGLVVVKHWRPRPVRTSEELAAPPSEALVPTVSERERGLEGASRP